MSSGVRRGFDSRSGFLTGEQRAGGSDKDDAEDERAAKEVHERPYRMPSELA